jgi:hypothetical protein
MLHFRAILSKIGVSGKGGDMTETDRVSGTASAQGLTPLVAGLCVIGIVAAWFSLKEVVSEEVLSVGDWLPVSLGWLAAASLGGIAGMWNMRRWGVHLYVIAALCSQLVRLYSVNWSPGDLVFPALFVAAIFTQLGKMR